jgi:23S rRNA (adenine2503-C2)-methyltransferase
MNELYLTQDGCIAKYVHEDGSETSIKTWPEGMESCGGSGRNKWNVFASCSVGCPIRCGFCFLTSKNYAYFPITALEISWNVLSAIKEELKRRPELKHIPFNLSWMGMGDPWVDLGKIQEATMLILKQLVDLVDEIEGVDIATTLPKISSGDINILDSINKFLQDSGKLTDRPKERTAVRVFYSLHSLIDENRKKIIPHTLPVDSALPYLANLSESYNVIYHYMFLDGINDSMRDVYALIDYFSTSKDQLRILRYNKCPNSSFHESRKFIRNIKALESKINLKVQLSPGSEISAACGMFLLTKNL